ncbi:ABC transporter substrate-binding protein [Leucobacter sp. UCMA 4100]|nr:ABC transporter substrate-binding protein [Leucobacter sp. UCMA 4100]
MNKFAGATALALTAGLVLSACSNTADNSANTDDAKDKAPATVTITDNHGEVEVPVNPETVVALDNLVFDTLSDWDVKLAAAPKGVMGSAWPEYTDDESVADVGNHIEPNLEAVVAAQPDLIIGGYRFGSYYDDLKAQNPDAVVIEIAPRDDEEEFSELKRQTEILGQIFDHEDEAAELTKQLDDAIAGAKDAYNGTDSVMAVNTSGGKIGYLAPVVGRALGPVFPALDLVAALEAEGDNDHKGNDIGVEAIAQSNPDWILALDRDASFAPEDREEGSAPAEELIKKSEALANVTAVKEDKVVILDPNFYLTEGIQAYTTLFNEIKDAFANA